VQAGGTAERCPGFVLHPSGAYYVPVLAAAAQVRAATAHASTLDSATVVCHPVSIPVLFTGSAVTTADVVCVGHDAAATTALHCQSLLQLQRL